jgi:hypothetical protein
VSSKGVHVVTPAADGLKIAFQAIRADGSDHPHLHHSQIAFRLRRMRAPDTMTAGLAADEQQLGLVT